MNKYFVSKEFYRYLGDWAVVLFFLLEVAFIGEHTKPFLREFQLNDPSIQHPFAEHERVPVVLCLLIATLVPVATIAVTLVTMHGGNFTKADKIKYHLHLLNISFLGLFLSLSINLFTIDLLKNWILRPRPDFIARCGPKITKGMDLTKNYDLSICQAPLGMKALYDGLRLCPSGHSGAAFGGLMYLALWLSGQLKAFKPGTPIWKLCLSFIPLVIAMYIALSRTQDYRHHFGDILLGAFIGSSIATAMYLKYFPLIFDFKNSHKPYSDGTDDDSPYTEIGEAVLPL